MCTNRTFGVIAAHRGVYTRNGRTGLWLGDDATVLPVRNIARLFSKVTRSGFGENGRSSFKKPTIATTIIIIIIMVIIVATTRTVGDLFEREIKSRIWRARRTGFYYYCVRLLCSRYYIRTHYAATSYLWPFGITIFSVSRRTPDDDAAAAAAATQKRPRHA